MSELNIGMLKEIDGKFIGDMKLTVDACSMCSKKDQVVLTIDLCEIIDDDTSYENICIPCLDFWAKALHVIYK